MSYQTKLEVSNWLRAHEIKNATINEDLSVDVGASVNLAGRNIKKIPIQFNFIEGDFNCQNNALTSLQGAPRVVKGTFNCRINKLESLCGGPQTVGGDYVCAFSNLKSLKGSPLLIMGHFNCSDNKLTTLEGGPKIVNNYFECGFNLLETLEHCPQNVLGAFKASYNKLTTLEFLPLSVASNIINLSSNKNLDHLQSITSFEDAKKEFLRIKAVKEYAKELSESLQVKPVSVKVKI